jgi:hypothetical protein
MWHSCGRFTLDAHFKGKAPAVRAAFEKLRDIIERCGPVEIVPQKTRVVFMTRMRFAACVARSKWLQGHLVLASHVNDPRFFSVVRFGATTFVHSYRAEGPEFYDKTFAALVRESYIRGRQEHARTPRWGLTKNSAR